MCGIIEIYLKIMTLESQTITIKCGKNDLHKELCGRCIENVAGNGEIRVFA